MKIDSEDFLYKLLPAIYHKRDAEQGYPLRAFLRLISREAKIIKDDINHLYENFFIETCDNWIIPYIGDLVGTSPLYDITQNNRVDVAKTIYYRRRKGTLPMLEELADDITGWNVHAVTFFNLLLWTQNLNHQRYSLKEKESKDRINPSVLENVGTVNLRNINTLDCINRPFDIVSHTVDVRSINQRDGWYNIKNIGFFLWRLQCYPLKHVEACPREENDGCYHFSPLGNPIPLFKRHIPETEETGVTEEINIQERIRPIDFYFNIDKYYGKGKSIYIEKIDGNNITPILIKDIICKDLQNWERPKEFECAIDVKLGRIAFKDSITKFPKQLRVSFWYGFSGNIGGGIYDRHSTIELPNDEVYQAVVSKNEPKEAYTVWKETIKDAITEWQEGNKLTAIITVLDNSTYQESLSIDLSDNQKLILQAGNKCRPVIRFLNKNNSDVGNNLNVLSNLIISGNDNINSKIILNGFVIEGGIKFNSNSIGYFELLHCTLIPGGKLNEQGEPEDKDFKSITVKSENVHLEIKIDKSITGPLKIPDDIKKLVIQDSIIDAMTYTQNDNGLAPYAISSPNKSRKNDVYGPSTHIERSTIIGKITIKELQLASEVIFSDPLNVKRRQEGCVRFSYVPQNSITPRRFKCQPDLAFSKCKDNKIYESLIPKFSSFRYGEPDYCQLNYYCPTEIKTGAEDGSEIGVFQPLMQPQREANLHIRLREYLPYSLKPGLIFKN
jgi:hypothetical protein